MSSTTTQLPSDLMEALMKDPVKRAMLLQLLNQEKDGFEAYKRREEKRLKNGTHLKKVQKLHCESPTALHRRRALEKLQQETTSESSSSELSEVATEVKGPKLPFEQLLKGVKAYVEVRRSDVDRSEGIKAVMRLMGATIKDQFTNDVTHVIFKDGSFTTYQKAKLMKVHLVSVLWLDAIRRNNARVPEKNYPAFGSKVCDENISILCSQLQKDYEDIVKDERRRSLALPEPLKVITKNRRKTVMTPQTSMSSYLTAQKSSRLLFSDEDREVDLITSKSPDLTSDDSDCGVIDGEISKRPKNRSDLLQLSPQITDDLNKSSTSKIDSRNSSFVESGGSESLIGRVTRHKRKTIHVITDMVISPSPKIDDMDKTKKILQNSMIQSSVLSSLRVSSSSSDLTKSGLDRMVGISGTSSDRTKSGLDKLIDSSSSNSKPSKNSNSKNKENRSLSTIGTTMSSLRLSDSFEKEREKPARSKKVANRSGSVSRTSLSSRKSQTPVRTKSESRERSPVDNVTRRIKGRKVSILPSKCQDEKESRSRKSSVTLLEENKNISKGKKNRETSVGRDSASVECLSPVGDSKVRRNRRSVSLLRSKSEDRLDEKKSENRTTIGSSDRSESDSENTKLEESFSKNGSRKSRERSVSSFESEVEEKNVKNNKTRKSSICPSKSESKDKMKNNEKSNKKLSSGVSPSEAGKISKNFQKDKDTGPRRSRRLSSSICNSETEDGHKKTNSLETGITKISKRTSSVSSKRTDTEDERASRDRQNQNNATYSRKSRKLSVSTCSSKSEDEETNFVEAVNTNTKRKKRTPSVSSNRSVSEERRMNDGNSMTSTPIKPPTHPSPAKKSRVESSPKKTRKLFNPDDITCVSPSEDDKEREEYMKQKLQKSTDDVFLNPNNVLITSLHSKNKTRNTSMQHLDWSSEESEIEEEQQKKKKKNKNKTLPPMRNSSADEQRDLLTLLTEKNDQVRFRRSQRLSLSQTQPNYGSASSSSQSSGNLPITPIKRRSTLDFQTISQTQQKRKLKLDPKRTTSIVCTKMHRHEVLNFEKTVKDLGTFFVEDQVSDKTTHLVAGESKRTINMLRAMARGCWILKREWLSKSKEEGKWLDEEDYEDTDFSVAVQQCRLQRQAFGPTYTMDIFKGCGCIYVGRLTTPRTEDLKELISICQGRVTTTYRNAAIVVGEHIKGEGVVCVTEAWVLDSITFNRLKMFKNYLIKPKNVGSPQF